MARGWWCNRNQKWNQIRVLDGNQLLALCLPQTRTMTQPRIWTRTQKSDVTVHLALDSDIASFFLVFQQSHHVRARCASQRAGHAPHVHHINDEELVFTVKGGRPQGVRAVGAALHHVGIHRGSVSARGARRASFFWPFPTRASFWPHLTQ